MLRPCHEHHAAKVIYDVSSWAAGPTRTMILKILTFVVAAIPIYLFIRGIFFRPSTRGSERLKQVKKQVDLAVTIFLVLICCVVAIMIGQLLWTWWAPR
jgi:hypothetical protein